MRADDGSQGGARRPWKMTYHPLGHDAEIELPFTLLVLADLGGQRAREPLLDRRVMRMQPDLIDRRIEQLRPRIRLGAVEGRAALPLEVSFSRLAEFELEGIRGRLGSAADEALGHGSGESEELLRILDDAELRNLESNWRSLAWLTARVPHRENVVLGALDVASGEWPQLVDDPGAGGRCALSQRLRPGGYFDGDSAFSRPPAVVIAGRNFGSTDADLALLARVARVVAAHGSMLVAGAASELVDALGGPTQSRTVHDAERGSSPLLAAWRSFRALPEARFAGLVWPRVLLRTGHDLGRARGAPLWGSGAHLFAYVCARSFAVARHGFWLSGHVAGRVDGLAARGDRGSEQGEPPPAVEHLLSDRRAFEFSNAGLIPLSAALGREDEGIFMSAGACFNAGPQSGLDEETVSRAATRSIARTLYVGRLVLYLEEMVREDAAGPGSRSALEARLRTWLDAVVHESQSTPSWGGMLSAASLELKTAEPPATGLDLELDLRFPDGTSLQERRHVA